MDLRIWLEKNTYHAGETAKGTLIIKANSSLKVQKFTFSVCGKERYLMPDGSIDDAEVRLRDSVIMVSDAQVDLPTLTCDKFGLIIIGILKRLREHKQEYHSY